MSELLELELIDLGPQVAIVEDIEEDALSIEKAFDDLNIGNQFFKADFVEPQYPEHPLSNIEIVFLDLHYNEGFGAAFDPYLCVNWIKSIVPEGKRYILIVWSRDVELTEELLATMEEMKVTMPYLTNSKPKKDYQIGKNQYDIERLLNELGIRLKEFKIDIQDFHGKILDVEEDTVLINCLINEDPKIFEIRRFDLQPFADYIPIKVGNFVRIKITTKPGSRTIDFATEITDLSDKFVKPDDPEDFGKIDWLNTPEE